MMELELIPLETEEERNKRLIEQANRVPLNPADIPEKQVHYETMAKTRKQSGN
jgi:hypothetical protein